jgi:hypothetical protein
MKATKHGKSVFPGNDLVDAKLQKDYDLRLLASEYRRELFNARAGKDAAAVAVVIKKFLPKVRKLSDAIDPPVSPLMAFYPPWPPGFNKPPELPPILPPHAMGLDILDLARQPITICDVHEEFLIESAAFRVFAQNPNDQDAEAQERAGKAAVGRAAAGNAFTSSVATVAFGYVSEFSIPDSVGETSLKVGSALNASFSWIEANPVEEGYARAAAKSECQVICFGESETGRMYTAPSQVLVDFAAYNEILFEMFLNTSAVHTLNIALPKEFSKHVYVYEIVELVADAPGEHAYIEGAFTWSPTNITMKAGCRTFSFGARRRYMREER